MINLDVRVWTISDETPKFATKGICQCVSRRGTPLATVDCIPSHALALDCVNTKPELKLLDKQDDSTDITPTEAG